MEFLIPQKKKFSLSGVPSGISKEKYYQELFGGSTTLSGTPREGVHLYQGLFRRKEKMFIEKFLRGLKGQYRLQQKREK